MEKLEKISIDDFLPFFCLGLYVIFLLVGLVKNIKRFKKLNSQDENVRHLLAHLVDVERRRNLYIYLNSFGILIFPVMCTAWANEKMAIAVSVPICLAFCFIAFNFLTEWTKISIQKQINKTRSSDKSQFKEFLIDDKQQPPEVFMVTSMFLVFPIIDFSFLIVRDLWLEDIALCIILITLVVASTSLQMCFLFRFDDFCKFLFKSFGNNSRSSEMAQAEFSKENLVKEEVSPKRDCLFSPLNICLLLGLSSFLIFCVIVDVDQIPTTIGFFTFSVMAFLTKFSENSSDEVLECLLQNAAARCQKSEVEESTPHPSRTNEDATSSSASSATSSVEHQISGKEESAASSAQSDIKESISISIDQC